MFGKSLVCSTAFVITGWVTLMKGVSGVPNDDLYRLWASSETRNQDNAQAMAPTADFPGHYKPALSNYWESCNFDQVSKIISGIP